MAYNTLLDVFTALVALSLLSMVAQVWRGKHVPDRVVAADQISVHLVALIALYAIRTNQEALLDLLIVFMMLGFLSSITIARFYERTGE